MECFIGVRSSWFFVLIFCLAILLIIESEILKFLLLLKCLFPFSSVKFFFYKVIYFIYLFLAALGLRCCARGFSSCGERGLLFLVVRGLLIAMASLIVEHGL